MMYQNQYNTTAFPPPPPPSGFPGYGSYGYNFYPPNYQQHYPPQSVVTPPPPPPSQGHTPPLPSQDHTPPAPPLPSEPPPPPSTTTQDSKPSEEAPIVTSANGETPPVPVSEPTAETPTDNTPPEDSNKVSEAQQSVAQSVNTQTAVPASQWPQYAWQQDYAQWQNAAAWSGQAYPPNGGVVPGYYQQWNGGQWQQHYSAWPPPPPQWSAGQPGADAWTGNSWPQWQGQANSTTLPEQSYSNQSTQQTHGNVSQSQHHNSPDNTDNKQQAMTDCTQQHDHTYSEPMDSQPSKPYSPSHPTTEPLSNDVTSPNTQPPVGYSPAVYEKQPSYQQGYEKGSGYQQGYQKEPGYQQGIESRPGYQKEPGYQQGYEKQSGYQRGYEQERGYQQSGGSALLPTPPENSQMEREQHVGAKRKWAPIGEQQQDLAVPPPGQGGARVPKIEEDRTPPPPPLTPAELKNQADAKRGPWPPSLKSYIDRAFIACTSSEESDKVQEFLQTELNTIFQEKKQLEIDWEHYPLPTEEGFKKKRSRWDTPSPSPQQDSTKGSPYQSGRGPRGRGFGMRGTLQSGGANDGWQPVGRGRGRRRKKNKGKNRGKNKFFIDKEPGLTVEDTARISQRAQRFCSGGEGNKNFKKKLSIDILARSLTTCSFEDGDVNFIVVGTSQALEKQYLRLTSAPDPSTVRPEPVLKRSLEHVKAKWLANKDYHYMCEQLKSIRQDLTIQGVRNLFTVEVYETHGRVALENGDREEFNQCQTQLMALYKEGLAGCLAEFLAYRILYLMLTDSTSEMPTVLTELTSDLRHSPCVSHALQVHSAWLLSNYYRFFQLCRSAPNMGPALMNMFIDRERRDALRALAKAFRPSLAVDRVFSILGFADDSSAGLEFLSSVGAVLDASGASLDCKLTAANL